MEAQCAGSIGVTKLHKQRNVVMYMQLTVHVRKTGWYSLAAPLSYIGG